MELLVFLLVFFCVGGFLVYRSDPLFWKTVRHRSLRIVRANIEARRSKPELTAIDLLPEKEAQKVWSEEFEPPKHEIIRTDYYDSVTGPWPQWHCKCGESGYVAVAESLKVAKLRCKAQGVIHVREMNKAEDENNDNGGDFAF